MYPNPLWKTRPPFLTRAPCDAGKYVRHGLEAQLPTNSPSEKTVAVEALVHVLIDDNWLNIFTLMSRGIIGATQR